MVPLSLKAVVVVQEKKKKIRIFLSKGRGLSKCAGEGGLSH